MALWWIANLVLLAVVIPLLLVILVRLVKPVLEIKRSVDALGEAGDRLVSQLDASEGQRPRSRTSDALARSGGAPDVPA